MTKLKFMQKLEDNPEALGLNISGWNSYVDWKQVRGLEKERVYVLFVLFRMSLIVSIQTMRKLSVLLKV